jgi:hypothetical protein
MVLQLILMAVVVASVEVEARRLIKENAKETPYYVTYPKGRFPIAGFWSLEDAREYAILTPRSKAISWNKESDDGKVKIFERGGKHIETYIDGYLESEYPGIGARSRVNSTWKMGSPSRRTELVMRNGLPYYVEQDDMTLGAFTLKEAKGYAVSTTAGLYRLNGQLSVKTVKIFEKGGKHIETIIDGMSESEYNEVKAKRGNEEENEKEPIKAVMSFGWNSAKMR